MMIVIIAIRARRRLWEQRKTGMHLHEQESGVGVRTTQICKYIM